MLKVFVEEAAALASIALFVGMIAVWAQLIPSSEVELGGFGKRPEELPGEKLDGEGKSRVPHGLLAPKAPPLRGESALEGGLASLRPSDCPIP